MDRTHSTQSSHSVTSFRKLKRFLRSTFRGLEGVRPSARHTHKRPLFLEQLETRMVPSAAQPTGLEVEMLERLNDARANPAAYGQSIGVDLSAVAPSQPLAFNLSLVSSSEQHSQDMNAHNYFGHNGSDGSSPFQRMSNAGYPWVGAAESISAGQSSVETSLSGLIADVGISDLGHRKQLLSWGGTPYTSEQETGVGVVMGGSGGYHNYYTLDSGNTSDGTPILTGVAYNDANKSGFYDNGEGLGGVTITAVGSGGTYTTTTGPAGNYSLRLPSGAYTVTANGAGLNSVSQAVSVGSTNYRLNFTPATGPAVPTVDNGQPGYTESGPDWQDRTTSLGYGGNLAYAPAGTGQDTASWQLTGLAAGSYDVQTTWYAYANRATNAPYRIYDGSTLLATVTVNQQVAPSGTAVGGFQFQSLGQFNITSGTLKVVLSNAANGYVFADALRAAPGAPTPTVTNLVDNGTSGYAESGPDWQDRTTSLGYGGNLAYAPAGTGQDTASWQLTGLAAGTYDVQTTWYAYANRATNAPFSIYDGSTLLATVIVNQQVAPSGTAINGFQFQSLGQFKIQSGTLKVVLSNNANGYVFADAVHAAPVAAPVTTVIVDNGTSGYAESGPDWQDRTTSLGYGGNLAYAPAGTGQDTATWQVTNLAAGTYDVQTTWYAFSNRATNAPYSIYDGNTLLATVTVNQQVAPSGTTVGGFQFQSLGTFKVQSGTLKVVLSNAANGYVFADALRVVGS